VEFSRTLLKAIRVSSLRRYSSALKIGHVTPLAQPRISDNERQPEETTVDKLALKVLLVEDNAVDAELLLKTVANAPGFDLTWSVVNRLDTALKLLDAREHFDVLVLDLSLPDSHGLQTVERAQAAAPGVPIVVLSGVDDETIGLNAVRAGAQDYVIKGRMAGEVLLRTLRYAVERQRLQSQILSLALTDILTDLYNRRGFMTLAEQQLKSLGRTREIMFLYLILVDVDNLKHVNDTYGHATGDHVLVDTAQILRKTFRGSDIIARLGGDEFVALAASTSDTSAEIFLTRLQANAETHNAQAAEPHFTLSAGAVLVEEENRGDIDKLMRRADEAMYEHKRSKKRER
jgi:two-component system, cell cycle response regulator